MLQVEEYSLPPSKDSLAKMKRAIPSFCGFFTQNTLESLSLSGAAFEFELDSISHALASNTAMRAFSNMQSVKTLKGLECLISTLRDHNCSLQTLPIGVLSLKITQHISFFLRLNMFGRSEAGNRATQCSRFVELLCRVCAIKDKSVSDECIKQNHNLLFSLLDVSTNVWAGSVIQKAKKASSRLRQIRIISIK